MIAEYNRILAFYYNPKINKTKVLTFTLKTFPTPDSRLKTANKE